VAIHIRLSELARELGVKVGFLLETLQKMGAYLEPAGTPNLLHAPERHARNPSKRTRSRRAMVTKMVTVTKNEGP
jgi:hypothetical protein